MEFPHAHNSDVLACILLSLAFHYQVESNRVRFSNLRGYIDMVYGMREQRLPVSTTCNLTANCGASISSHCPDTLYDYVTQGRKRMSDRVLSYLKLGFK
jgi:hypothetical protein